MLRKKGEDLFKKKKENVKEKQYSRISVCSFYLDLHHVYSA